MKAFICRKSAAHASADAAVDMDDDMPSPRSLRAAAERLAQYTSETQETASGAVSTVFSDLYSEVILQSCLHPNVPKLNGTKRFFVTFH